MMTSGCHPTMTSGEHALWRTKKKLLGCLDDASGMTLTIKSQLFEMRRRQGGQKTARETEPQLCRPPQGQTSPENESSQKHQRRPPHTLQVRFSNCITTDADNDDNDDECDYHPLRAGCGGESGSWQRCIGAFQSIRFTGNGRCVGPAYREWKQGQKKRQLRRELTWT